MWIIRSKAPLFPKHRPFLPESAGEGPGLCRVLGCGRAWGPTQTPSAPPAPREVKMWPLRAEVPRGRGLGGGSVFGGEFESASSILPPSPGPQGAGVAEARLGPFSGCWCHWAALWVFFFFLFGFGVCVCVCVCLETHPLHMEVPRLGVKLELQPPAYTTAPATRDPSCICNLHHSSQQRWILNPLREARDRTHVLKDTSRVC